MEHKKFYKVTIFAELDTDNIQVMPKAEGFVLSIPKCLNRDAFFDEKGVPNENAVRLMTKLLVESLAANIHVGHQKGNYDGAKHLREIIDSLENHFVANCEVDFGFVDKKGFFNGQEQ
jgi:hypothetical protein